FGIETLWIRLAWVLLFLLGGTGLFIYILLWILMPSAGTTAEKLAMSGKPVNITNIEQKVKEGFSSVKDSAKDSLDYAKDSLSEAANKIKNGNYDRVGNKIQSTSRSFFDALGSVIMFCFTIFAKFFGIILIITGAATLIGLVIGLLSLGVADIFHFPGIDMADVINSSNLPIWIVSLLTLFAVGIPFFFIFVLGLKILVPNTKSPGKVANFTLFGVWLAAIVTLSIFAAREVTEFAREASVTNNIELNITANDTLYVKMVGNDLYSNYLHRGYDFDILYDDNDEKKIYSSNLRLIFKSTKDSLASISIEKSARGNTYQNAKKRAVNVNYNYTFDNNELVLDAYFLTDAINKFRDQEVEVTIYLPEGSVIYADDNTYTFHRNSSYYGDILNNGSEGHYMKVMHRDLLCMDCGDNSYIENTKNSVDKSSPSTDNEKVEAVIDSSGININ
ncbi:MAG: hypothetical protein COA96_16295, partial [SAR86 cluster bacterium]